MTYLGFIFYTEKTQQKCQQKYVDFLYPLYIQSGHKYLHTNKVIDFFCQLQYTVIKIKQ